MTSLIDVIFLLLLFFMLSSTFSRFAEVEISSASGGGQGSADQKVAFMQVSPDGLTLDGRDVALDAIDTAFADIAPDQESLPVIISLKSEVTSQDLTDLLVVLRTVERLKINVLGT